MCGAVTTYGSPGAVWVTLPAALEVSPKLTRAWKSDAGAVDGPSVKLAGVEVIVGRNVTVGVTGVNQQLGTIACISRGYHPECHGVTQRSQTVVVGAEIRCPARPQPAVGVWLPSI